MRRKSKLEGQRQRTNGSAASELVAFELDAMEMFQLRTVRLTGQVRVLPSILLRLSLHYWAAVARGDRWRAG